MTHDQVIKRALKILEARMRSDSTTALTSPSAVRDYLRLLLHDRPHEVFPSAVFLDSQNRLPWRRRNCSAARCAQTSGPIS